MFHALVLGASGISGWSLMNQAVAYPTPTTFSRITGTTNRPLSLSDAYLPNDPRYKLVSGIDFTKPVEEVAVLLKEKISDVDTVSHVFFAAYIDAGDLETRNTINTKILDVSVRALEKVAPALKTVILQTGGKGYGMEFVNEVEIKAPLSEDIPRIPEHLAKKVFYYSQYDLLQRLSKGKSWTFTEVRPDIIPGFCPTSNPMNLAEGIGLYLSIWRQVHGSGSVVPFPGTDRSYNCTHGDSFQDIVSRMEIFAAVNYEKCGNGKAFNIQNGKVVTWAEVWPKICEHFQLVGGGPIANATPMGDFAKENASAGAPLVSEHGLNNTAMQHFQLAGGGPIANATPMGDFAKENASAWASLVSEHGLDNTVMQRYNWQFAQAMLYYYDFDREFDLSHARSVGFTEEVDTAQGYITAWERMRVAKRLPPLP